MSVPTVSKKPKRRSSKSKTPEFDRELAMKCEKLIGHRITSMQYPGGNSRDSVRLLLKRGDPVFVSTRSRKSKADIERLVLKTVFDKGANVPKLLGSDGQKLLIQQEIPGLRLSQAIHKQKSKTIYRHLDKALGSLATIQRVGSENGLDEKLPCLGHTEEWLSGLLERPKILGRFLEIPAPVMDFESIKKLLVVKKPRFVKWDARPGNAIVNNDGEVFWIDWEHSGARNRLDDMVWLLADEFIPHRPTVQYQLLEKYLPVYAESLSEEQAYQYFFTLSVFHLVIRMGLILKNKKDGGWWSYDKCLLGDKAGVTLKNMFRICKRGRRWAAKTEHARAMSPWFENIEAKFAE